MLSGSLYDNICQLIAHNLSISCCNWNKTIHHHHSLPMGSLMLMFLQSWSISSSQIYQKMVGLLEKEKSYQIINKIQKLRLISNGLLEASFWRQVLDIYLNTIVFNFALYFIYTTLCEPSARMSVFGDRFFILYLYFIYTELYFNRVLNTVVKITLHTTLKHLRSFGLFCWMKKKMV